MKTYIWTLSVRIIHWLLVIGLVAAYILGEEDNFLGTHIAIGYTIGILLIYRIIIGFSGPRYSGFKDFPLRIAALKEYIVDMKKNKQKYTGHNPLSSVVMLAIFLDILLIVTSGILILAANGQGFLKNIFTQTDPRFYKEMHEVFVNILILLVIIHLAGLVIDMVFNSHTRTFQSIFTGYKNVSGENAIEKKMPNIVFVFVLAIAAYIFGSTLNSDIEIEKKHEKHFQENEDHDNDDD